MYQPSGIQITNTKRLCITITMYNISITRKREEKTMGEIKQTNFRIDQDTATAFRKFCEDNGMNQAQGFDHVMQVVELDRAKTAAPGRATEIESFEKSVKDIMAAYLNSLEITPPPRRVSASSSPPTSLARIRPSTSCAKRSSSFSPNGMRPRRCTPQPRHARALPQRRWKQHSAPPPIRSASTPC